MWSHSNQYLVVLKQTVVDKEIVDVEKKGKLRMKIEQN